jgi:hypothetical protein
MVDSWAGRDYAAAAAASCCWLLLGDGGSWKASW